VLWLPHHLIGQQGDGVLPALCPQASQEARQNLEVGVANMSNGEVILVIICFSFGAFLGHWVSKKMMP